jgi:hypothetical protein
MTWKTISILLRGQTAPLRFDGVSEDSADDLETKYVDGSRNRIRIVEDGETSVRLVDLGDIVSIEIDDDPEAEPD